MREGTEPRSVPSSFEALCTVLADHLLAVHQLRAVVHQEAAHAGELVLLLRLDLDGQLLVGQVGAGELEGLSGLRLVLVDLAGVLVVPARLELLDRLFGLLVVVLARGVVIGRHPRSCPPTSWPNSWHCLLRP